jgi:cytochrome P450
MSDLVSALIRAEEAGDKLSEDELLAMVFLLLIAGHETTVNLIGSGTLALLEHPDEMEKLRRGPTLIMPAVEELLRYTAPVFMSTERYAREDVTVHGVTIPRGELTLGVIGSANRDETVFENPDRLDITREPNRHLPFGRGIHFCLCASGARGGADCRQHAATPDAKLTSKSSAGLVALASEYDFAGLDALPVAF